MTTASHARVVAAAVLVLLGMAPAARADDTEPPKIMHIAPRTAKPGAPLTITATFIDDSPLFAPRLVYRFDGAATFQSVPMLGEDIEFSATIPAGASEVIEYCIEVFDEHGNGPAQFGTTERPQRVSVKTSKRALSSDNDELTALDAPEPRESTSIAPVGGISLAVVAGLGFALGGYFGLASSAAHERAVSATAARPAVDEQKLASSSAFHANLSFGASLICAGVAAFLLTRTPEDPSSSFVVQRQADGLPFAMEVAR